MKPLKLGVIGCGNISKTYFTCAKTFRSIEIVACADIQKAAADAKAAEYGIQSMEVDQILKDPNIDMIINLTIPQAHAEIAIAALNAGKHVHSEKPLATNLEDGKKILALAKKKNLRVGSAPDTFLGAGHQTCRKLIDDGWIGKPIAGTAFLASRGPESWHPNPAFFYDVGGGPMLDMGPYYFTALINFLGPIKKIIGVATKSFNERIATCKEHFNEKIPVKVPTLNTGVLEFASGALVNILISFDIYKHGHSPIEIYGTEGSLIVPDPNTFGNEIKAFRPEMGGWQVMPYSHHYNENTRIIAAAEMAHAIATGKPHRASGELAYHVLEAMLAFEKIGKEGGIYLMESTCEKPAALKIGTPKGLVE